METVSGAGSGEERMVRIALEAPEAMALTRAGGAGYTNSAKGGVTNVDRTQYDLRYKLAVYDAKGNTVVVEPMTQTNRERGWNQCHHLRRSLGGGAGIQICGLGGLCDDGHYR